MEPYWRVSVGCTRSGPRLTRGVACRLDEAALSKKELVLIEALDFKLLERHPYEALETLLQGTLLASRQSVCVASHAVATDASLIHHTTRCYALVNDTYRHTDLCMLQPPEARCLSKLLAPQR